VGDDPDGDLRELVHRGDRAGAVHHLMQRHGPAVYRYCRVALRDAALAEDVHQQVFVEAFRDLPRFAGRSTLRIWLFSIARHRVLDAAKKRRRAANSVDEILAAEVADPRPLATESIDDARLRAALLASLAELDARTRTTLLLRYQQGFSFTEMAAICGEKPSTLNARVVRALPQLRRAIEARLPPSGGRLRRTSRAADDDGAIDPCELSSPAAA
jgi:RNA polymerase sigma-70 factor (ECF subfamily)